MFDKSWDQLTPSEKLEMHTILSDESHSDNEGEPTELVSGPYEGDGADPKYEDAPTLAGISLVNVDSATSAPISSLEGVDFSEESIDYVYPTQANETHEEAEDTTIDGYGDEDIEADDEAVEAQIIDRKLRGYGAQAIARELEIQYGVPVETAVTKVNSTEVSTNDKIANTFFGKLYKECNEAEIQELRLYSGSDE